MIMQSANFPTGGPLFLKNLLQLPVFEKAQFVTALGIEPPQ